MSNYKDRLRRDIQFTSPSGAVFNARWIGDEAPQPKKIGVFEIAGVDGSVTQDLGLKSAVYPLSIFFEGDQNDLETLRFMKAYKERGVWQVIHPVVGLKTLQPLSFTPDWQPVTSGGITRITTEWMEPLGPAAVASVPELQALVSAQVLAVNSVAAEQLEEITFQDTAAEIGGFRSAVKDAVASVSDKLDAISEFSAAVTAEINAIKRDIDAVLAVVPLDILAVAGQLQELIQLPARALADVEARLDSYSSLADDLSFSLTPDTPSTSGLNRVAVQELCLTAVMGAVSDVSSTGELTSRPEAIEIINGNNNLFGDATDALDASQSLFDGQSIDTQYFSQSQSFTAAARMNALTVAYLLRSAFDLKTEKRFVLKSDSNPVIVALREYGGAGENDENIKLFIDSNKIEGSEHIMMKRGREVVVYI